jgi:hypothetical protein
VSDKIYGLIGWYVHSPAQYGYSATITRWQVAWRMSEAEIAQVKETCEVELKCLNEEIDELFRRKAEARNLDSSYDRGNVITRKRRSPNIKSISKQERAFREETARISAKAIEIIKRYAAEMFDPLYPIGAFDIDKHQRPPEVFYEVLVFEEDPKELRKGALIKMRAKLHGDLIIEGLTNDDDNDDKIAVIGYDDSEDDVNEAT